MKVETRCKFCGNTVQVEVDPEGAAVVEEALAAKGGADRLLNGVACNRCADDRTRRYGRRQASQEEIERARNAGGPDA
jgi:hypothetical protein